MAIAKLNWLLLAGTLAVLAALPAQALELQIGGYRLVWKTPREQEILVGFEETQEFDQYTARYNELQATSTVARLGYSRIGFINTDNLEPYTLYVENGRVRSVVHGLDSPEFTAEASIEKIRIHVVNQDYEAILREIKVPWTVKLRALRLLWSE